jgi:NAD(P)-dependent dehydrogenase (short-subunit alcohol dehydrogenase family)
MPDIDQPKPIVPAGDPAEIEDTDIAVRGQPVQPALPTATGRARTALVTGAGRRLGREIALMLAVQGWDVAVHCRASREEAEATADDIRAMGRHACVVQADLADEAACHAVVPQVVHALGRLDAVVNNASAFEYDTAATFTYAMLEHHLRANTAPAIVLAQALASHVAEREGLAAPTGTGQAGPGAALPDDVDAAVVNLLDQKLWNPNPDFLSYTLSKAALESATSLLALALAPRVRVVGVAPGLTLTSEWLQGDRFEQLHKASPLGRSSTPGDVATTVAFALANRSITGTTLLVDGGQHLQRFSRDFSMM